MRVRAMFVRRTLARWAICATALVLAGTDAMQGQFSGPALGVSPQQNQVQTPTTDTAILSPAVRDPRI